MNGSTFQRNTCEIKSRTSHRIEHSFVFHIRCTISRCSHPVKFDITSHFTCLVIRIYEQIFFCWNQLQIIVYQKQLRIMTVMTTAVRRRLSMHQPVDARTRSSIIYNLLPCQRVRQWCQPPRQDCTWTSLARAILFSQYFEKINIRSWNTLLELRTAKIRLMSIFWMTETFFNICWN